MDFKNPIWAFCLCVTIVVAVVVTRDCGNKLQERQQEQWTSCVKSCGGSALVNTPANGCFCIKENTP